MREELAEVFSTRTTNAWCEALRDTGVRYAPVRDHRQALEDPGAWENGYFTEAVILAGTVAVAGVTAIHTGMFAARPFVLERFGLYLAPGLPGWFDGAVVIVVTVAAGVIAALPAWRAYRFSLADGLSIRT